MYIYFTAVAWIIIPLEFSIVISGFVFNSWRLFVGIFGLPCLLAAFLVSKYPESPKFLLSQGQDDKALAVMRQMFMSNTNKEVHHYPVSINCSYTIFSGKTLKKKYMSEVEESHQHEGYMELIYL